MTERRQHQNQKREKRYKSDQIPGGNIARTRSDGRFQKMNSDTRTKTQFLGKIQGLLSSPSQLNKDTARPESLPPAQRIATNGTAAFATYGELRWPLRDSEISSGSMSGGMSSVARACTAPYELRPPKINLPHMSKWLKKTPATVSSPRLLSRRAIHRPSRC